MTITDRTGTAGPETRTVSMIINDGNMGRIRAAGAARPGPGAAPVPAVVNVDATPRAQPNGLIQFHLTLFYQPLRAPKADEPAQTSPTELDQSITVVLRDGQPLVVSRAADPVTDRRISVEVKATVLK